MVADNDEFFSYLPMSLPNELDPSSDDDSSHDSNGIVEVHDGNLLVVTSPPFESAPLYTQQTNDAADVLH